MNHAIIMIGFRLKKTHRSAIYFSINMESVLYGLLTVSFRFTLTLGWEIACHSDHAFNYFIEYQQLIANAFQRLPSRLSLSSTNPLINPSANKVICFQTLFLIQINVNDNNACMSRLLTVLAYRIQYLWHFYNL